VVTGLKNYNSTGTYVHVDSFQIHEASPSSIANDSALSYGGIWSRVATNGSYVNADAHASNTAGSTASYTFTGSSVQIIGDRDTNHGYADVTLDGTYEGRFDAYFNGATGGNKVLWEKDGLAPASHTIQITVVGAHDSHASDNYITIDAIAYGNGSLPTFATVADDSAATYSADWTDGTTNSSYVDSDAHWTDSATQTWNYMFTGTALQIVSDRDSNHGYGDVTIDGIYRGRYDAYYNSTQGGRQIVWEITGLPSGSHTVQVTAAGARDPSASDNYVVLDALYYQ